VCRNVHRKPDVKKIIPDANKTSIINRLSRIYFLRYVYANFSVT